MLGRCTAPEHFRKVGRGTCLEECADKEAHEGENETVFPMWTSRCSKPRDWAITAVPASAVEVALHIFLPVIFQNVKSLQRQAFPDFFLALCVEGGQPLV